MPTADELLPAAVVDQLVGCLALAAPGHQPAALRRAARALPGASLSERVRLVRDALLADLPGGYPPFEEVLRRALEQPDFTGWLIWPVSEALATLATERGGREFEQGLALLACLTGRLTGEFALRVFLNADLHRTLAVVRTWADHPDEHVRRLASEGTRARLPWAKRVPALLAEPTATVGLLDALYRDPSEYVRRSVANHLNDLSRADATVATDTARRWSAAPDGHTPAVVRHALRTLVKAGDPAALALLGFGPPERIELAEFAVGEPRVTGGGELSFSCTLTNRGTEPITLVIDYLIHHRKANGSLAPKVFKLATRVLDAGASTTLTRRHSFRPITTRRYYPGVHAVQVQVNGQRYPEQHFELLTS